MALLSATLASGLIGAFAGTDSFSAAGDAWASAYASYAQTAQANGIPAVFTGAEQRLLSGSLASAFAAGVNAPGSLLGALELAFQGFWYLPPVVFGTGVVTLAPPGLGTLVGATFGANLLAATAAEAANNVAVALDAWTRTVVVTFPGPVLASLL